MVVQSMKPFWRYETARACYLSLGRQVHRQNFRSQLCAAEPRLVARLAGLRRAYHGSTSEYRSHGERAPAIGSSDSTIYALSSAPGRAAIAVIRVSGAAALHIYRSLCPGKSDPRPRLAAVRTLYAAGKEPTRDNVLDSSALVLYFPSPKTATGEDVLELHVHGGPAVVKAVLAEIPKCSNDTAGPVRYAEPGEFTRRAFLNNRLDLTQVEAIGDTLAADTEQQRRLSVRGTTNQLARRYEQWRQQLVYARGELEALIDFSEDQHFDESPSELCLSVAQQVAALVKALQVHSQNAMRGELLRNGLSIAFLGAPNAGKSSLLNRIVGREAAIVSHEAGTTRDVVEVSIDVGGYLCRLGDTAGLRQAKKDAVTTGQCQDTISLIEREGMRRAKERAAESDVVVIVLSFERMTDRVEVFLDPGVRATAARLLAEKDNVIVVINKADLARDAGEIEAASRAVMAALPGLSRQRVHIVSCIEADDEQQQQRRTAETQLSGSVQGFLHGLIRQLASLTAAVTLAPTEHPGADPDPSVWEESLGATARHRALLEVSIGHLEAFLAQVARPGSQQDSTEGGAVIGSEPDIVLAAEYLRSAADCLGKITGKGDAGDVEEVLGVVFEKFCVGK